MRSIIKQLADLEIPVLPEIEDESVVTEGLGISSGYKLLKAYDSLIDLGILAWQYHFEFLNLGYAAYVVFVDFCQKAFPDIPLQKITQMVGGIDVIIYQPDEELKKLAKLSLELGVDETVMTAGAADAMFKSLEGSGSGKKWLEAFNGARDPWFYVSTGTGWYHHDASWNDDIEVPLSAIRIYIEKLRKGHNIERPTKAVRAERDRLTREYRALLKTDEDRQTVRSVARHCQDGLSLC